MKRKIEIEKDELFFVKHISSGLGQGKFYLVQVDMENLDHVDMIYYGVYHF